MNSISIAVDAWTDAKARERDNDQAAYEFEHEAAFNEAADEIKSANPAQLSDLVMQAAAFELSDRVLAAVRDLSDNNPNLMTQAPALRDAWASLHDAICTDRANNIGPARFQRTFCSQCGGAFGPGPHGFSYCSNHADKVRLG